MISVTSPAPLTARDVLNITSQQITGRSHYQGIQYTLKNTQPNHIQILHAEVINGVDEMVVAQQEAQQSAKKRRIAGGLLRGLSSVPFMGGVAYSSVGAYQAAAIGSHVASTAANVVESTADTSASIQGRFVRQFDSVFLSPQQAWSFTTLVPKGEAPHLKLVFKDLQTNQIFDLTE